MQYPYQPASTDRRQFNLQRLTCPPILQALIAFVGDSPDLTTMEDVLSGLADALHKSGLQQSLATLMRGHGGPCLFTSLLQREQPSLRVIGIQIISSLVASSPAQDGAGMLLFFSMHVRVYVYAVPVL